MKPVRIIAEAGVNHNGDEQIALELIDAAKKAGADAVKFQTFRAEELVTKSARKAIYQQRTGDSVESQFAMLKRLELDYASHHRLAAYCKKNKIDFLSSAFDSESLKFLVDDLHLQTLKIPSGEITNAPFLLEHAFTGCKLILSTGMADMVEIETALGVLAYGLTVNTGQRPDMKKFQEAYLTQAGQDALQKSVTLLHCTSEYPCPPLAVNLKAIATISEQFQLPVGYSDHSEGLTIAIAAAALGAKTIEKHFTLDKNMEGPDHQASLEPIELEEMIQAIRTVEQGLGDGLKVPQSSEIGNMKVARKSLVAAHDITQGEIFTQRNIVIKRPGTGMTPFAYWELLGQRASAAYMAGDLICE